MKRLLAIFICLIMVISCTSVSSAVYKGELIDSSLDVSVCNFYAKVMRTDGYFSSDQSPDIDIIMSILNGVLERGYTKYLLEDEVTGVFYYEIPANLFEAEALKCFANKDAVIKTLRSSEYYGENDEGLCYRYERYSVRRVSVNGVDPEASIYSYKSLGNGKYEVYCFAVLYPYTPAAGEVEMMDYLYIPYGTAEKTPAGMVTNNLVLKYVPAKICGAFKCTVLDKGDTFAYASFENMSVTEVSKVKGATKFDTFFSTKVMRYVDLASRVYVDIKHETFGTNDIYVLLKKLKGDPEYADLTKRLGSDQAVVTEVVATSGGNPLKYKNPVEIVFQFIGTPSDTFAVYKVDKDLSLTKLKSYSVDETKTDKVYTCWVHAEISGDGVYAIGKDLPEIEYETEEETTTKAPVKEPIETSHKEAVETKDAPKETSKPVSKPKPVATVDVTEKAEPVVTETGLEETETEITTDAETTGEETVTTAAEPLTEPVDVAVEQTETDTESLNENGDAEGGNKTVIVVVSVIAAIAVLAVIAVVIIKKRRSK